MRSLIPGVRGVRMVLDLSVDPFLLRWHASALTWNGLALTLALLLGSGLFLRRAVRLGIPPASAGHMVCVVLIGATLGARIVHILDHLPYYLDRPAETLAFADGSGSFTGALLGGTVTLMVVFRWRRLPFDIPLAAALPSVLLGTIMYALGSFLSGANWGIPTNGAWGVIYWHPHALIPPDLLSVPLHPYPLYQALLALVIGVWVWAKRDIRSITNKLVFGRYLIASAILADFSGSASLLDKGLLTVLGMALLVTWFCIKLQDRTRMQPVIQTRCEQETLG